MTAAVISSLRSRVTLPGNIGLQDSLCSMEGLAGRTSEPQPPSPWSSLPGTTGTAARSALLPWRVQIVGSSSADCPFRLPHIRSQNKQLWENGRSNQLGSQRMCDQVQPLHKASRLGAHLSRGSAEPVSSERCWMPNLCSRSGKEYRRSEPHRQARSPRNRGGTRG